MTGPHGIVPLLGDPTALRGTAGLTVPSALCERDTRDWRVGHAESLERSRGASSRAAAACARLSCRAPCSGLRLREVSPLIAKTLKAFLEMERYR
jgi:hypothetical protein